MTNKFLIFIVPTDPFIIKETETKDSHLDQGFKKNWVEESFIYSPKGPGIPHEQPGAFLKLSLGEKRIKRYFYCLLCFVLLLAGRAFFLQIVHADYYQGLAEGNRLRTYVAKAERGVILDRQQRILVRNIPNFHLFLIPADLPAEQEERQQLFQSIAKITGENLESIVAKIQSAPRNSVQPLLIKEDLSYQQALLLKVQSSIWRGINLVLDNQRQYVLTADSAPASTGLSHLLGFLGKISPEEWEQYQKDGYQFTDKIGRAGLEAFYEKTLRGEDGKQEVEVDAFGRPKAILSEKSKEAGNNLILTIDFALQQKAQEILSRHLRQNNKKKGVVVALDPNNGEILAMVSLPAFNNNIFSTALAPSAFQAVISNPDQPLFNRAISGQYPPGSLFKPIVAAAGLQENIISAASRILSIGGIRIDKWFFPDWNPAGHGWVNVKEAIAYSVNTFFYTIGGGYQDFIGLGQPRIVAYARLFGLGSALGLDMEGEASGFLPTKEWKETVKKEPWYIGDTYHLSIGQGDILVTPLQAAGYTAVFANGGTLFQSHLVKSIVNSKNETIKVFEAKILKKDFLQKSVLQTVRQGLRDTVVYGSGKKLNILPVTLAAKTGTAQQLPGKSPHAWITTFGPYQNPRLVITVLVEEGGEGSKIPLEIAREIWQWWNEHCALQNTCG